MRVKSFMGMLLTGSILASSTMLASAEYVSPSSLMTKENKLGVYAEGADRNGYIHLNNGSTLTLGEGFGADKDWVVVEFMPSVWGNNQYKDICFNDTKGKHIFGYCLNHAESAGKDMAFYMGDGERGYGAVNERLSNYIKTEMGDGAVESDTKQYFTHDADKLCFVIENYNGDLTGTEAVENGYYTVSAYKNTGSLGKYSRISTEYYSGNAKGIGAILSDGTAWGDQTTYYKDLTFYGGNYASEPTAATATAVTPDPDEGQTKDAIGFKYEGNLEQNQTINSITWTVTDSSNGKTAKVNATSENGIPQITGGSFTIGLLITDVQAEKIENLSATVTVE